MRARVCASCSFDHVCGYAKRRKGHACMERRKSTCVRIQTGTRAHACVSKQVHNRAHMLFCRCQSGVHTRSLFIRINRRPAHKPEKLLLRLAPLPSSLGLPTTTGSHCFISIYLRICHHVYLCLLSHPCRYVPLFLSICFYFISLCAYIINVHYALMYLPMHSCIPVCIYEYRCMHIYGKHTDVTMHLGIVDRRINATRGPSPRLPLACASSASRLGYTATHCKTL